MRLAVLVAVSVAAAALVGATPHHDHGHNNFMSLGVSTDNAQEGSAWAMLSLDSPDVNFGSKLRVKFQRVMQETKAARVHDFIGLYWGKDPKVDDPWNWEAVNKTQETGEVVMDANKAGDMEVRLVRPPNQILARVALKVHPPCNPLCYRHGTCVQGECVCNEGYLLPNCGSVDPDGLEITAKDENGELEFQANKPIHAHLHHHVHGVQINGDDYLGIYPVESANGTSALVWKAVPAGNITRSIELPGVKVPGEYVLRFTRREDLLVLAQSKPFTVYEFCPHQCYNNGKCVTGKCQCYPGFTTHDCSVGPGMVNMTVHVDADNRLKKNQPVRVSFTRVHNPDYPLLLSDSDWIGLYRPMDNTSDPFAYQYAQVDDSTADDAPVQYGEVVFMIPPHSDYFVFKYIRNDRNVMNVSLPIAVYKPCKYANCSDHGDCDEGVCVCEPGWTGEGCERGDIDCNIIVNTENLLVNDPLTVTFERGVGTGTEDDYLGLYIDTSESNTEGLYGWQHAIGAPMVTQPSGYSGFVQMTMPRPGKFRVRYVNVYSANTLCESELFEVHPRCPDDCSGHGVCVNGTCQCEGDWLMPSCRRASGSIIITPPDKVLLPHNFFLHANFTATVSRPEGWYQLGDFIGVYPVPMDPSAEVSPMSILSYQVASDKAGPHTVDLSVPGAIHPGLYKLWYVNGMTYEKEAESEAFEIVTDCNEGSWDLELNKCVCPVDKQGDLCEADTCCFDLSLDMTRGHPRDNLTVSWARPHKNGRNTDLIALYLHNATKYDAPYAYAFADGGDGDSGEVKLMLPFIEETFAVHYVSSRGNMSSAAKSENVYVTLPCEPADCSNNGVCLSGKCMCSSGYGGSACDKAIPLEASLVVESEGAVTAGGALPVRWTRTADIGAHGDYVGIYRRMGSSNQPYTYAYPPIDSETFEGVLQMAAPSTPGTYQARWIKAKTGDAQIVGAEFDVE